MTTLRALSSPASDVLEMVDLESLVDDFEPVMCESTLHNVDYRLPPHLAHWWACSPCLSLIAVCEDRKRKAQRDDGWRCTRGCTAVHPYSHIEFVRI
jgi:hypothetical protein